jgi:hypothetical protein
MKDARVFHLLQALRPRGKGQQYWPDEGCREPPKRVLVILVDHTGKVSSLPPCESKLRNAKQHTVCTSTPGHSDFMLMQGHGMCANPLCVGRQALWMIHRGQLVSNTPVHASSHIPALIIP